MSYGKTVLVTGGARRIGAAICKKFGEAGWHVVVHCNRSVEEAEALAAALPSAEVVRCDLANDEAAITMIYEVATRHEDWRCLINCAAIFSPDEVTALDPDTNRKAMQINALTPVRLAQTYFAHATSMAGRRVVQVTDQKLANLNPDFFSYTMSKSAVDVAAQMLAMAHSGDDRIYRLAPGAILASHDQSREEAEHSHRLNLLKRRTGSEEIANAALFCAEGSLASGQEVIVDSGQHLLDQDRDVIFLTREEDETA